MKILGTPATEQEQQPTARQLIAVIMTVTITVMSIPIPIPTLTQTLTLIHILTHILTEKSWTVSNTS
jgi:hypothetical protein